MDERDAINTQFQQLQTIQQKSAVEVTALAAEVASLSAAKAEAEARAAAAIQAALVPVVAAVPESDSPAQEQLKATIVGPTIMQSLFDL